jgi:hypothetical protein
MRLLAWVVLAMAPALLYYLWSRNDWTREDLLPATASMVGAPSKAEVDVLRKVESIRAICGDVCDTNLTGPFDEDTGIFVIRKEFDCENIFRHASLHDAFDSLVGDVSFLGSI